LLDHFFYISNRSIFHIVNVLRVDTCRAGFFLHLSKLLME